MDADSDADDSWVIRTEATDDDDQQTTKRSRRFDAADNVGCGDVGMRWERVVSTVLILQCTVRYGTFVVLRAPKHNAQRAVEGTRVWQSAAMEKRQTIPEQTTRSSTEVTAREAAAGKGGATRIVRSRRLRRKAFG